MTLPSKKIDRYMIPVFPILCYLAVVGYLEIWKVLKGFKKLFVFLIVLVFGVFVVMPDFTFFPYLFTYTSPLFGSAENANRIIAQKPFGIGIFKLRDEIVTRYQGYPKLGFIDVKPIDAIYPNSKVFDIRVYGPGDYDYIVLGINETFPDSISKDRRFIFEKDFSIYINGLEYWRIYAKKTK
jgi:hypothetical protein